MSKSFLFHTLHICIISASVEYKYFYNEMSDDTAYTMENPNTLTGGYFQPQARVLDFGAAESVSSF